MYRKWITLASGISTLLLAGAVAQAKVPEEQAARLEGGDLLVLRDDLIMIGYSERTTTRGIDTLMRAIARKGGVQNFIVVEIPKSRATIHLDMIRTAFATRSKIAIAPMQDYLGLGSEARINVPGTSSNNWRWRLLDTQLTDAVCDNVAGMVTAAGRAPAQ